MVCACCVGVCGGDLVRGGHVYVHILICYAAASVLCCADMLACAVLARPAASVLLRILATHEDTRPRLWRAMRDWDWTPLVRCLGLQVRLVRQAVRGRPPASYSLTS